MRRMCIIQFIAIALLPALALAETLMDQMDTALMRAIASDDANAVRDALHQDPGAVSRAVDDLGRSPLHLTARHDARRVAEALLSAGADFYARDDNGQLPLDLLPGEQMNDTRKWLRELNRSRNEFLKAVHEQRVDQVKALLSADPSLAGARDIGDGWSAAMTACHFGNEELLRALLDAGAAVDTTDFSTGQTAVHIAAEKGHVACVRHLIEARADVAAMATIPYGRLPMRMNALHVAAWKGHGEIVAALLEAGADPNARAPSYAVFSPLHLAAADGHAGIVKQLLAAGADPAARDGRRGITPLEMAEAAKHTAVAEVLRQ